MMTPWQRAAQAEAYANATCHLLIEEPDNGTYKAIVNSAHVEARHARFVAKAWDMGMIACAASALAGAALIRFFG